MKKILLLVLAATAAVVLMSQCGQNPSKKAMKELEALVEKADRDKDNMTQEQLEALNDQISEKIDAIDADQLSDADKMKCFGLTMHWASTYMEVSSKQFDAQPDEIMPDADTEFADDLSEPDAAQE